VEAPLKTWRLAKAKGLTQAEMAHQIGSSQSRVAKMEGGETHPFRWTCSLRPSFKPGAKKKDIGRKIAAA
jgi:DNA-binding XRE family transcriptional regulator